MLAALLMATALLSMGLVVFWIEPLGVLGVIEKLTPNVTYRVRTHLPVVALSFDDGPHPRFTLQVLEILNCPSFPVVVRHLPSFGASLAQKFSCGFQCA